MAIFYVILGLAVGSFLNLCIDRLPKSQSIITPPSHCSACQRRLGFTDLVPILSYLLLQGRCRYCGATIPLRVLAVEVILGGVFGFLWWWLGPGTQLLVASLYASLFIVIATVDLEHGLILNRVIYPAIVVAPFAAWVYGLGMMEIIAGGLTGFIIMLLPYLLYKGGLGAGDIKLGVFVGTISGFPEVLVAIFAAAIFGGITAAFLLLTGIKGRKDPIPFAPFLIVGATIALIGGKRLTSWYLGFY